MRSWPEVFHASRCALASCMASRTSSSSTASSSLHGPSAAAPLSCRCTASSTAASNFMRSPGDLNMPFFTTLSSATLSGKGRTQLFTPTSALSLVDRKRTRTLCSLPSAGSGFLSSLTLRISHGHHGKPRHLPQMMSPRASDGGAAAEDPAAPSSGMMLATVSLLVCALLAHSARACRTHRARERRRGLLRSRRLRKRAELQRKFSRTTRYCRMRRSLGRSPQKPNHPTEARL